MAAFSKTLQAAIVPWLGLARFSLLLRSPLRLQNPPRVTVMVAVAVMVVVAGIMGTWSLRHRALLLSQDIVSLVVRTRMSSSDEFDG